VSLRSKDDGFLLFELDDNEPVSSSTSSPLNDLSMLMKNSDEEMRCTLRTRKRFVQADNYDWDREVRMSLTML
jgi:hypothetical protein